MELERLDFFLPPHYMAMTSLAMAPHLAFPIFPMSNGCQVLSFVPDVLVFNLFNLLTLYTFESRSSPLWKVSSHGATLQVHSAKHCPGSCKSFVCSEFQVTLMTTSMWKALFGFSLGQSPCKPKLLITFYSLFQVDQFPALSKFKF